jgi:MFS family permease
VAPTTAALLSTGFTLPYALIQSLLGSLADMFSQTRLIALSMLPRSGDARLPPALCCTALRKSM